MTVRRKGGAMDIALSFAGYLFIQVRFNVFLLWVVLD